MEEIFGIDQPYREEQLETEGLEYTWKAGLETREEGTEVLMTYSFPRDLYEDLSSYISERHLPYEEPFTGKELFPSLDLREGKTEVNLWIPPLERPSQHEFAYFPSQYLEQLRDDFLEELRPFL